MILLEHDIDGIRERALSRFAGRACGALKIRGEVCVLITSNREMQKLNLRHCRKNKATDVLSFPAAHPQFAGDLAISAEIAAANALQLGHSAEAELKILILHGLLHLAGYDHENDSGEMHARERALRQEFRLPATLIERTQGRDAQSPPRQGRLAMTKRRGSSQ